MFFSFNFFCQIADKLLRVNLHSYLYLASHALPALIRNGGNIVAVSSMAGKNGYPHVAPYSAAKHGIHGFFDSLRQDLAMKNIFNVSITTCVIGNIDTESAVENTKGYLSKLKRYPARFAPL